MDCNKKITANFSQVEPKQVTTNSWLIGGIVAGVILVGVIIGLVVKHRIA